jgi:uncharacterized BrkB/YihY/UPF0761 family membrane protein
MLDKVILFLVIGGILILVGLQLFGATNIMTSGIDLTGWNPYNALVVKLLPFAILLGVGYWLLHSWRSRNGNG